MFATHARITEITQPALEILEPLKRVHREDKRRMPRPYELVLIIDSSLEEDAIKATIDKATDLIKNQSGSVGRVDKWGRKRFSYEINKKTEGYYCVVGFDAEPEAVAELDRVLSISDEVVRHKIIRTPEQSKKQKAASTPVSEPVA